MDTTHHPIFILWNCQVQYMLCSSCTFFSLDSQTVRKVTPCSEGVADVTGEVKLRLGKTPGTESKRLLLIPKACSVDINFEDSFSVFFG